MDQVLISASDGVAACRGFYHYIEEYCQGHISWDGHQLDFFNNPDYELPNVKTALTSSSQFTYYQNVCTWSYSFVWWTWSEWRRHIYWMALQGINLALAPFQELVWKELYSELGLSEEEIKEHISGPGFLAWQRMGNIRGWGGPMSDSLMQRNSELQAKIIELSNNLGISLALPAFAGHVPLAFKRIFPEANYTKVVRWNRFPDRFCCPLFLDPMDPLFQDVGARFLNKTISRYGTNHIYFADPFNEINPARNDTDYMSSVAAGIYHSMEQVDANAIWLLQGWMFNKNPFWGDDMIKSFLTAVPQGRILVLDLQSEQHPQYERTYSYYGQPYIWCMLHNFGGTLDIHGSMDVVNQRVFYAKNLPNSTFVGVGITPEGIFQNYIMYELALKQAWYTTHYDLEQWVNGYARRRYGVKDDNIEMAMQLLRGSVYSYVGLDKISGKYAVCRRPTVGFTSMVSQIVNKCLKFTLLLLVLNLQSWYDYSTLEDAWEFLLNTTSTNSTLFVMDLVDVTRQALQNKGEDLYTVIMQAYTHNEIEAVEEMGKEFLDLLKDMDRILATHPRFLLGPWLEAAKALAADDEERDLLEQNARAQITTWGPTGEITDYATKQWSGMFNDFFVNRWTVFFEEMLKAMRHNRQVNKKKLARKILYSVEIPFLFEKKSYPVVASGEDPKIVARELYDKWANNFNRLEGNGSASVYLV